MKRIVGIAIVVIVVAAVGVSVWNAVRRKQKQEIAPSIEAIQKEQGIPVTVSSPNVTNLAQRAVFDAVIEPSERARLMSEIGGRIRRINFEEGQAVEAGECVVQLYDDAYQAAADAARTEFNDAKTNLNRVATLLKRGGVSRSAYDAAAVRLERARSALVKARDELDDCTINSPVTGVLSRRYVDPGAVTAAGTLLAEIVDVSRLKIKIYIPESRVSLVRTGMVAEVSVDALKDEALRTRISRINPELNERGRRIEAVGYIDGRQTEAVPGMFGTASIQYGTRSNAVVVPSSILVARGAEAGVFIMKQGRAEFREIKTGIRSDGLVEVVSGLEKDAWIVVDGSKQVVDGSRVQVTEEN